MTKSDERNSFKTNLILAILSLGFMMTFIDLTVMNVALPLIASDLNTTIDKLLWAVNSYVLVVSALLITMGRLGDIVGTRAMFLWGTAIFVAASLAVGAASNPTVMIFFRALQGLGTAMLLPQNLAIIVQIVPAERRGATLGVLGTVAGFAAIAGPALGGLVAATSGWRWIFLINLPIGLVVIPLAWRFLPRERPAKTPSIDVAGTVLIAVALLSLTYLLMEARNTGLTAVMQAAAVLCVLSIGLLIWQQKKRQRDNPLIPFELFQAPGFLAMNLVIAASSVSIIALILIISIFIQSGLGYSAFYAGLSVVPASLVSMLLASPAGKLADRYPGRGLVLVGLLISASGIAALIVVMYFLAGEAATASSLLKPIDLWVLIPPMIIIGVGNAIVVSPTNALAMREVPNELAGAASGIFNTVRQIGIVGAVTFAGVVIDLILGRPLDVETQNNASLMASTMPDAMWLSVAAMLVGAICCFTVGPTPKMESIVKSNM